MSKMICFDDGYIEYNLSAMFIVLEDPHYASNNIYCMQGGFTWDDFFKFKDKNLSIVHLIEELQKKYNEYNGISEK